MLRDLEAALEAVPTEPLNVDHRKLVLAARVRVRDPKDLTSRPRQ